MNIRTTTMLLTMAALATSCTNQSLPFAIEKFFPLSAGADTGSCQLPTEIDTVALSGGSLDVAAGTPQFFAGVRIFTTSTGSGATAVVLKGGEVLEPANRNRPIVTQQVISYRLSKRLGAAPKPFIINRNLSFTTAGIIDAPIQLISPDLGTQLFDGLTASKTLDDVVDIQVDVEFKGVYAATQSPFATGTLTFPIRAFRSQPDPCAGTTQYKRFPFHVDPLDGTSAPDLCAYAGQQNGVVTLPTPPNPADCCAPGTVGC